MLEEKEKRGKESTGEESKGEKQGTHNSDKKKKKQMG